MKSNKIFKFNLKRFNFNEIKPRFDFKGITAKKEEYENSIKIRNLDSHEINLQNSIDLYHKESNLKLKIEHLQKERNEISKQMKKERNEDLIKRVKEIKEEISNLEKENENLSTELIHNFSKIPNLCSKETPLSEQKFLYSNFLIEEEKEKEKQQDLVKVKKNKLNHYDISTRLNLIDFESGSTTSHPKSYYLKNDAIFLEMALIQYTLQFLRKKNFDCFSTPELIKNKMIESCGFQPRGAHSQIYSIENSDLSLIGTSEISLAALYSNKILKKFDLPLKLGGVSNCFRKEAGSGGSHDFKRGLYRVHQFKKVEMFVFSTPEDSEKEFEKLIEIQKELYNTLGIPFRVLEMPAIDLGNPAYRKIDIEAYFTGKGDFGEISSTSNCLDFQSRRFFTRYKNDDKKNYYVHTLNGTALAIPRIMIAILENNQFLENGILKVEIPKVLQSFMGKTELSE